MTDSLLMACLVVVCALLVGLVIRETQIERVEKCRAIEEWYDDEGITDRVDYDYYYRRCVKL